MAGKAMNWLGDADTMREYIFVPDAMRIAAAIGQHAEAFGSHWCLPGAGPLSGRQLTEIVSRHLGRAVKLRAAGLLMLRAVSLFNKDLRGFMQVAPNYMKPVSYDARKLEALLGPPQMTAYDPASARRSTGSRRARISALLLLSGAPDAIVSPPCPGAIADEQAC